MEIERKFLILKENMPKNIENYECLHIEQAYLCINPVVRVRRQNEEYILTYKGVGMMTREEYNLPLTREGYVHLLKKADGVIISKNRYVIPYEKYKIELDCFLGDYEGLFLAEVEFPSEEEAKAFNVPEWFGEDVTFDGRYHNSYMSRQKPKQ